MRKRDDDKERSIKEAVVKLILEEGFHGASISKIAKVAGVSPATVYIYFDNKEIMLQDIYREYSEEIFNYILNRIHSEIDGRSTIEILVRSYYEYIQQNEEIFNFVDQFSSCPSLVSGCSLLKGLANMERLITEMKNERIIKNYQNENLLAIIFYPVKSIAINRRKSEAERDAMLQELIEIIQSALLI